MILNLTSSVGRHRMPSILKRYCVLLFVLFNFIHPSLGQSPDIEWTKVDAPPVDWYYQSISDNSQSGDDWWYAHTNYYFNGQHVGYIAVGRSSWQQHSDLNTGDNFVYPFDNDETCSDFSPPPIEDGTVDHLKLERTAPEPWTKNGGGSRQTVALYLLDGTMVWCKRFNFGSFWNVYQDDAGDIVCMGHTYDVEPVNPVSDVAPEDLFANKYLSGVDQNMYYNPGQNGAFNTLPETLCPATGGGGSLSLVKLNGTGSTMFDPTIGKIMFNYIYGYYQTSTILEEMESSYNAQGRGWDIVEDNGHYYISGAHGAYLNGTSNKDFLFS